ncbi:phosphoribosylformylglycinamidine synthase [Peptostreptococcaceae bacterium AS15]|nr:phosphoribosylformylglycinamidine synthase [Peptostreptococcaceae bacterium AS15]
MLYQVFVEKKEEFASEAKSLLSDCHTFLGIKNLEKIRIINRYYVENISEQSFEYSIKTIFSEPQLDIVSENLNVDTPFIFAVEALPGQFDQRADSAMQCIQIISNGQMPIVNFAKIFCLYGYISKEDINKIKKYVINPVESREASLDTPKSIITHYESGKAVEVIDNFIDFDDKQLEEFHKKLSLAMDINDLMMCRDHFKAEKRNPTITEIRVIDTYWSDHCRHTTFNTIIDDVKFENKLIEQTYNQYLKLRDELNIKKPITLMDIGTISAKYLKKTGILKNLDESEEVNACTVKIDVNVNGKKEPYLLLFKNETHNHPTEIEPFGGAATCIGGAIRDPLSGRAYVYAAMRVTGVGNPLTSIDKTIVGKLPQRKIVTGATAGYSSYGNQVGVTTGLVDEIYHDGYLAKHMEIGAVIAAAPEKNVIREKPKSGDVVILLGGATGRDGIGGATGSSKSHDESSVETCGAQVQKGNAPQERKIQRLFRSEEACRMIKRCNDFGAGGVAVAIGELTDGLDINLNAVPKKYEGLDATELAISESQERMAVVVQNKDKDRFLELAAEENIQATVVATVKEDPYLTMYYNDTKVVDISRSFLDTNGAEKHIKITTESPKFLEEKRSYNFKEDYINMLSDLNICSKRGLNERFDSNIGSNTVLLPFGGKNQLSPIQAMVHKVSVEKDDTSTCSIMSYGYNPFISEKSPFHGAYMAVVDSLCKIVAVGGGYDNIYLSFQEYFENLEKDEKRWGKPLSSLLGAFKAQMDYKLAAIGGKDSMSGTFENLTVPPTLVSFAVTTQEIDNIISPEFKKSGNSVYFIKAEFDDNHLPKAENLREIFDKISKLIKEKKIISAYAVGMGGVAEAIYKMSIGNYLGFQFNDTLDIQDIFKQNFASFLVEVEDDIEIGVKIGKIVDTPHISYKNELISLDEMSKGYEEKLESIYSCNINQSNNEKMISPEYKVNAWSSAGIKVAKPKVVIPVFPGTNCEYDTAKAVERAGATAEIFVIKNLNSDMLKKSIEDFAKIIDASQVILIPGGFSAGDEPDGSAKFITAFFRNELIKDKVTDFLDNKGNLMAGICNGFQALIKLGLLPYGKIIDTNEKSPTLTYNKIGRHQAMIVRTKLISNKSPWFSQAEVGKAYNVPISHGEGRFIASDDEIQELFKNGQVATQYVDFEGNPTDNIKFNPNGSMYAIESITSFDGRIIGKMGHSERIGYGLYKNLPGDYDMKLFESAVKYFK